MALKISTSTQTFDLSPDFNIEIEDTSPVYNDRGSQSVAATLPATANNLKLVNHIHRLDTNNAPEENARVTVSDGIYQRIGKMNITQTSRSDGIVSNIGFDESEAYSIWNAVSLRTLKNLPIYETDNGVEGIIAYMNNILNEQITDEPLHVFPICVSMQSISENNTEKYLPEYLNAVSKIDATHYRLNADARTETYIIDGKEVATSLPLGYGITPFLKVSWLLDFIFSCYGYRVAENPFKTHPQLARLVVLNNTADCCVKGFIDYTDLMPECTINEFLQALYCRFGMVYFIDGKTRTARFKFIKDIISAPASQDYSLLKAAEPVTNFEERQQLKLSASTSISGPYPKLNAAPAADSLDKFLAPYNYLVADMYSDGYLCYTNYDGVYLIRNIFTGSYEAISSDFFPWDRGGNISYHEISSVDECLPIKGSYPDDVTACPAYLLGKIHRYTNITSSDVELSEDLETQTPLCFCFSMPLLATSYPYGSPRCTGPGGETVTDSNGYTYDISMTFVGEDGLFNRFWKSYDAILRHANHTIEVPLRLSLSQLLTSDFSKPVALDGQRMLIDLHRYQLPLHLSTPATIKLRTLKLLHPYDLEQEQNIPITKQLYKWDFINNREIVTNSIIGEQVQKWKAGLASNATWLGTNRKNEVSDSISYAEIPYTVPTQADYDSQHTYFIKKVNYKFDLYYKVRTIKEYTSQGIPIYQDKEYGGVHYELQYNLWIQAALL